MKLAPNAAALLEWKEALLALSDKRFFELMRLYLGVIKTPFSKQRLVDELCAFLQKEDVRARILGCLDALDLKIVCAVRSLARPDRQRLVGFFAGSHSYPEIYSRLLNMEERLLIFRSDEDSSCGYRINPLFEDELKARARLSLLVSPAAPPEGFAQAADAPPDALSPASGAAAAGIFAFFANENIALTKRLALKKKDAEAFKAAFPTLATPPDILVKALRRLSLVSIEGDGRVAANFAAWQAFAALSPLERASWLCAGLSSPNAASGVLARKAALFAVVARQISPQALYSGESVRRLFILAEDALKTRDVALISSQSPAAGEMSRFSSLLQEAAQGEGEGAPLSETEAAVRFALLVERGGLFTANADLLKDEDDSPQQSILVDSSFKARVLPKAPLKALLPAARFLCVERVEKAGLFRVERKAAAASFAAGEDAESAKAAFEAAGAHLPENVLEEIELWHRSFCSLRLYSGVVAKADDELIPLFREGGRLFYLVQEEIARGVFLLAGNSIEEIESELSLQCPKIACARGKKATGGAGAGAARRFVFQMELPRARCELEASSSEQAATQIEDISAQTQKSLLAKLDEMETSGYARAVLEERIMQKIVISEAQLVPECIRYEKTEAGRLDLNGKRLLAEVALREGRLLEVETAEGLAPDAEPQLFVVRPTRACKDAIFGALEPDGAPCEFSLARAVRVRLLPQPIFDI